MQQPFSNDTSLNANQGTEMMAPQLRGKAKDRCDRCDRHRKGCVYQPGNSDCEYCLKGNGHVCKITPNRPKRKDPPRPSRRKQKSSLRTNPNLIASNHLLYTADNATNRPNVVATSLTMHYALPQILNTPASEFAGGNATHSPTSFSAMDNANLPHTTMPTYASPETAYSGLGSPTLTNLQRAGGDIPAYNYLDIPDMNMVTAQYPSAVLDDNETGPQWIGIDSWPLANAPASTSQQFHSTTGEDIFDPHFTSSNMTSSLSTAPHSPTFASNHASANLSYFYNSASDSSGLHSLAYQTTRPSIIPETTSPRDVWLPNDASVAAPSIDSAEASRTNTYGAGSLPLSGMGQFRQQNLSGSDTLPGRSQLLEPIGGYYTEDLERPRFLNELYDIGFYYS